jgi:hypothetical protein
MEGVTLQPGPQKQGKAARGGFMRSWRLILLAALLLVPMAMTANAQVSVGVGVGIGPAVVAGPVAYGPPVCGWGYYPYYPYDCAPYGYYGPSWFVGGVFIGAGPWYHSGWGHGYWGHGGWGYPHVNPYHGAGYGYRGGIPGTHPGYNGGNSFRGGVPGTRPGMNGGGGARFSGAFHGGGGGGFHGGGGGFHGGGGHR